MGGHCFGCCVANAEFGHGHDGDFHAHRHRTSRALDGALPARLGSDIGAQGCNFRFVAGDQPEIVEVWGQSISWLSLGRFVAPPAIAERASALMNLRQAPHSNRRRLPDPLPPLCWASCSHVRQPSGCAQEYPLVDDHLEHLEACLQEQSQPSRHLLPKPKS